MKIKKVSVPAKKKSYKNRLKIFDSFSIEKE